MNLAGLCIEKHIEGVIHGSEMSRVDVEEIRSIIVILENEGKTGLSKMSVLRHLSNLLMKK